MKILWLSHLIPYPPKAGVLQRSYHLVREVARYHEVDLLAFNQINLIQPLFSSIEEGVEQAEKVLKGYCGKIAFFDIVSDRGRWGKHLLALKSLCREPYNINWLKSSAFANQFQSWLNIKKYDLVHFDTISLLPYLSLLPTGIATCLDHHNIESHMLLRRSCKENNILKKIYFWQEGVRLARYERRFCPQFSLNITCSDIDTRRLLKIAPQAKVKTIPNGVDLSYFHNRNVEESGERIIFVGTMNWYPNIEAVHYIADKLWFKLKRKYPDLQCDIIGANPVDSIKRLGHELDGFNVLGFVEDVRPYLERAAVYVCPIQDGGGTKLKILDAMAMSKAIVAHPLACEGIDVSDGKNVLLADTDASFLQHIECLFNSPSKRKVLGHNARQLIETKYGFDTIGKKLAAEFEKLHG